MCVVCWPSLSIMARFFPLAARAPRLITRPCCPCDGIADHVDRKAFRPPGSSSREPSSMTMISASERPHQLRQQCFETAASLECRQDDANVPSIRLSFHLSLLRLFTLDGGPRKSAIC